MRGTCREQLFGGKQLVGFEFGFEQRIDFELVFRIGIEQLVGG